MKQFLRTLLCTPESTDLRSWLGYLFWQRVVGINRAARWPVHFTSRVVRPDRVIRGRSSYPGDMPGCYIQATNGIQVGDYCLFGPGVGLISANHDPDNYENHLPSPPIILESHCWVGMNAVILPGVHLGPRTIVGAGAIVTSSFPGGHCVLAGNPARVVRQLGSTEPAAAKTSAPEGVQ